MLLLYTAARCSSTSDRRTSTECAATPAELVYIEDHILSQGVLLDMKAEVRDNESKHTILLTVEYKNVTPSHFNNAAVGNVSFVPKLTDDH